MIFGDCPYEDCEGTHAIATPEKTPAFSKETCETCGREYWLMHSRIVPEAFTIEDFEKKFEVDEENKSIKKKELIHVHTQQQNRREMHMRKSKKNV